MREDATRRQRLAWVALSLVVALSGLLCVFLGDFWRDESWYYAGSWLTIHGSLPHVDFFVHHDPLLFYVYGAVQGLAGPSLLVGRIESWVFWLASVLLLARLAWKLGGAGAATLFLVLVATNPFATRYFVTFTWRPLELFLMSLALTVVASERPKGGRYATVALLLALVVGLRFPIDLSTALLALFLGYVGIRFRHERRLVVASFAAAGVVLVVLVLPYVWRAPDQYLFDVVRFPLGMASYLRSRGLLTEWSGPVTSFFSAVRLFGSELRFFFASVALFLAVMAYRIAELRSRGTAGWRQWCLERGEWWWLTVAYVLIGEALATASRQGTPVTRIVSFMLGSLLVSVECARLFRAASPEMRRALAAAIGVVVCLSPFLQDLNSPGVRARWASSDVFLLRKAAATVRASTTPDKAILTFDPALATEADRRIGLDMIMEVWSVFPGWSTDVCTRYHLTNIPMLLGAIDGRRVGAIVLSTPGRLDDDAGIGAELRPYRAAIREAIGSGYRVVASVSGPREGRAEPVLVDVYVPK
ncbi:MAG: hypothetical protein ACHQU8_00140 [Gemmatimonadales bacterium]